MEFEDMKMIWDTQNNEPLYAVNKEALHVRIKEKGQAIEQSLHFFEWMLILALIVAGTMILVSGIANNEDWPSYLSVALTYTLAGNLYRMRRQRQSLERKFDDSLLGNIDKAIAQIDYQIKRARTIFWWCVLPAAIIFSIPVLDNGALYLVWFVMGGSYAISYWQTEKEIKSVHLPRKHDLEALCQLLTIPEVVDNTRV